MNTSCVKSAKPAHLFRQMKHLAAVLGLFLLALSARATTVIPPDFDHLLTRAQVIFEGEVTGVQSQWIGEGSEHRIVTFVTFKVDDCLKGDAGTSYTMRMLGGTVDGETMEVTDAPKFAVGDHDLLFVENNGSQFIPLVGIRHGRFRIHQQQNGDQTLSTGEDETLTDVGQLGSNEKAMSVGHQPLTLKDFKERIRNRLQQLKGAKQTP